MLEAPVLTYVAEITLPKIRGMLAATASTCVILGVFSQFFMATFLTWRSITIVSSCIPILAIVLLYFVPESPHWLILKKRNEEAKESLMWLRGWQHSFESVKKEFDELYNNLSQKAAGKKKGLMREFKKRTFIFPYIICSLSFFIGHFSGMTTLQTYSVIIFSSLNAPMDKYWATTLLGTLELIGTIICVIFVKFVGKRKLAFFSTTGCGICFLLTAIYAMIISQTNSSIDGSGFNSTIEAATNASDLMTEIAETAINVTKRSVDVSSSDLVNLSGSERSAYSWIPLSLLLTSALLSHSGIRLLPWMLIGEGEIV
jgi:MFS family permease